MSGEKNLQVQVQAVNWVNDTEAQISGTLLSNGRNVTVRVSAAKGRELIATLATGGSPGPVTITPEQINSII